jgi:hypothetical protein
MLPELIEVGSPGQLGPTSTIALLLLFLAALGAVFVGAVRQAVRAARLARQAAEQGARGAPPAEGPAVIFGAVQMARDEAVAMRVEIDQEGSEAESSGSYSFAWKEVDRRIEMRPFYVVLASGERVRVEPDKDAFLVDAMDGMILVHETARTRYAELSPGEEIYAVGELRRAHDPELSPTGYRSGKDGWVLRAPPGGDLLLSSEALDQRFRRRARAARVTAATAAALALAVASLCAPYFARAAGGEVVEATVVDRELHTGEDSKSYSLIVEASGGRISLSADERAYDRAASLPMRVPVRFVKAWPWASTLGRENGLHIGGVLGGVAAVILMLILRAHFRAKSSAWYEGKLVDKGSGKLSENASSTRSG